MEFGTGVMTITPWHSQVDYELAKKYNLDTEQIIGWDGKLLPVAGEFAGIKIKEARPKIVEKLKEKGLLIKVDGNYKNVIKKCYKCATVIEPQIKDQWFVKMEPLAKMALDSVDRGEIKFIPDNYEKIFRYWMENNIDWNISRQIVWGINIPAWFRDDEVVASIEKPDGGGWIKDTDTFDTWFSSGQWPLMVTGFPDGKDFNTYYPTDVMETGHDLIFKWVPRMVIFGLYLGGKAPFHTVYLHGLVNDAKGKKMSKSKGNVVNPLTLTDKFGTDALRMALIVGNTPGTDLALQEDKVKAYKNFANKMWNATRFVLENTKDFTLPENAEYDEEDKKTDEELKELVKEITAEMDEYKFYLVAEKLYHYFWHSFADIIIERSKKKIIENRNADSAKALLLNQLNTLVVALHPFMPFITEEIWSMIPHHENKQKNLLIIQSWPK